jgi:hypothetical protein
MSDILKEAEEICNAGNAEARRLEAECTGLVELVQTGNTALMESMEIARDRAEEAAKWRRIAIKERAHFIKYRCKALYGKDEQIEKFMKHAADELETEIGDHIVGANALIELTPERRNAIQTAIILFDTAIRDEKADLDCVFEVAGLTSDVEILRSMLEEAGE